MITGCFVCTVFVIFGAFLGCEVGGIPSRDSLFDSAPLWTHTRLLLLVYESFRILFGSE
jgi:hypothetical protein